MAVRGLSNLTLHINNMNIFYKPNSLVYKEGLGEQKVRTHSGGGGKTETVFTEDAESKFSVVKFALFPEARSQELIRIWHGLANANVITIGGTGFTRTFTFMALVTDPEIALGADTSYELEFHGEPAV